MLILKQTISLHNISVQFLVENERLTWEFFLKTSGQTFDSLSLNLTKV